MLNKIWLSFFVASFLTALVSFFWGGDIAVFDRIIDSLFSMAGLSVELALGLIGVLAFWSGILKLAEQSGLANGLAKLMEPIFSRLMPEIPKGHPALGFVTLNMASNMLGLDNAATPVGLKAMQSLQSLNPNKTVASNAQILFLVINTSSVTIFPVTIIMYRLQQGASAPTEIFLPILLATLSSTLVGLLAVAKIQKLRLIDPVLMLTGTVFVSILGLLVFWLTQMPTEQMAKVSSALGNGLLFSTIVLIIGFAFIKGVDLFEEFTQGAKEGFDIAVRIIPFMVAMLCAIGVLRASGLLESITHLLTKLFSLLGWDTRFVDALPTALMRPFSASGSRAMMLETMSSQGVDSFAAKLSAIVQGSTETTFYVIAVYFGAVGIKRVRHAIGCGLLADLAGILTSVFVAYWFFG